MNRASAAAPTVGELRVLRETRAILIESLWWDASVATLNWVDITAGTLHTGPLDGAPDGADDRVIRLPPPASAFQPSADGGYVAALLDSVVRLDAAGSITHTLATIEHAHPELRFNEGKCDPFGAFVVGSMELRDDSPTGPADGAIYRVHPDGSVDLLVGGLGVANGFEWSESGDTFYFTDTPMKTVYAADYSARGELASVRPHLVGHSSDGLARDAGGGFWNGCYGEGLVVHWSADGEVDLEIEIPAPNVTSVALVGPELSTLVIGTARENLTEEQLVEHPLSGAIFALDTSTRGHPVSRFG